MKIAVVSPYYRESDQKLRRCLDSVMSQTKPCTHIMVADGHPNPIAEPPSMGQEHRRQHIVLPQAHGDYGDTPRAIGTMSAFTQGFDAVCWLDGDNWFDQDHIARMAELALEQGVAVVTASRKLWGTDGKFLGDCTESDGKNFCDTNCYFLTRPAMHLAMHWVFKDRKLSAVGDRVIFAAMKQAFAAWFHCSTPTVNYETSFAAHYIQRGLEPPEDSKIVFQANTEEGFRSMLYSEFLKKYDQSKFVPYDHQ